MPFKFNRLTLLANIFSLQFTEISEYHPSSSYRTSKSRFFPYIHCKFGRVCPTTKMASATVKSSIWLPSSDNYITHLLVQSNTAGHHRAIGDQVRYTAPERNRHFRSQTAGISGLSIKNLLQI